LPGSATCRSRVEGLADDEGLGLAEILVAMFLLAILSVSFLPVLIAGLQLAVQTSQNNTATQLVNEQLDLLAGTDSTCVALTIFASASLPTVTDERGVEYTVDRVAASCSSATFPTVVSVQLTVTIDDGSTREMSVDSSFLLREAG
jgi:type II secretory pathway pseudopilin PulG